jgi:RNA methyltransferase, TrmH family
VVAEAVAARAPVVTVFALEGDAAAVDLAASCGARLLMVTEAVLGRLSTTTEPQSPVAIMTIPAPSLPETGRLLVPWGVGDPGNCGTLIRSAAAFGYGYAAGPGTAATWSPKVVRAGAGAHFRTTVGTVEALDALRAGRRPLYAAVAEGGSPPGPLPPDAAVLIGNESTGLDAAAVDGADELVTIPMVGGTESLNAAVAGSIIAYLGAAGDAPGRGGPWNVLPSQPS